MDENTPTPEEETLRAEARRIMEAKIDALPESFRTVFVLRALEELSVEETATVLSIPEATVRTRFFRARSLLRESLSREMDMAPRRRLPLRRRALRPHHGARGRALEAAAFGQLKGNPNTIPSRRAADVILRICERPPLAANRRNFLSRVGR